MRTAQLSYNSKANLLLHAAPKHVADHFSNMLRIIHALQIRLSRLDENGYVRWQRMLQKT